jgi:hypothetical protein
MHRRMHRRSVLLALATAFSLVGMTQISEAAILDPSTPSGLLLSYNQPLSAPGTYSLIASSPLAQTTGTAQIDIDLNNDVTSANISAVPISVDQVSINALKTISALKTFELVEPHLSSPPRWVANQIAHADFTIAKDSKPKKNPNVILPPNVSLLYVVLCVVLLNGVLYFVFSLMGRS